MYSHFCDHFYENCHFLKISLFFLARLAWHDKTATQLAQRLGQEGRQNGSLADCPGWSEKTINKKAMMEKRVCLQET